MQQNIPGVGQVVAAKLTLFREAESAYTEPLSKSVRQVQGVGVYLASRIEDGVRDYIQSCRVRADMETVRAERRRQAAENRRRQLEEQRRQQEEQRGQQEEQRCRQKEAKKSQLLEAKKSPMTELGVQCLWLACKGRYFRQFEHLCSHLKSKHLGKNGCSVAQPALARAHASAESDDGYRVQLLREYITQHFPAGMHTRNLSSFYQSLNLSSFANERKGYGKIRDFCERNNKDISILGSTLFVIQHAPTTSQPLPPPPQQQQQPQQQAPPQTLDALAAELKKREVVAQMRIEKTEAERKKREEEAQKQKQIENEISSSRRLSAFRSRSRSRSHSPESRGLV